MNSLFTSINLNIGFGFTIGGLLCLGSYFHKYYTNKLENACQNLEQSENTINSMLSIAENASKEIKNIEKLNQKLIKERIESSNLSGENLCVICYDNQSKFIAHVPCGHLYSCQNCSFKYKYKNCAICNSRINGSYVIYNMLLE